MPVRLEVHFTGRWFYQRTGETFIETCSRLAVGVRIEVTMLKLSRGKLEAGFVVCNLLCGVFCFRLPDEGSWN